jgi:hypothetical protein
MRTVAHIDGEWRARMLHAFQSHLRSERYVIDDYRQLVEQTTDPGTRFLVEQILVDEQRHHEMFRIMTTDEQAWPGEAGPSMPAPDPSLDEVGGLLDATARFLAAERQDRQQLRRLRRDLAAVDKHSAWSLVVELMEIDTMKHIRILEELRTRLHDVLPRR